MLLQSALARAVLILVLVLALARPAAANSIVISAVYGGGGNIGATYTNDFIELFNASTVAVNLAGWSLQYASATGAGLFGAPAQITPLSGIVDPGHYFLVVEDEGIYGTLALPSPDVKGSIAMSATAGKVALVKSASSLGCNGGSAPCTSEQLAAIVDLIGYGNANFFEGVAAPGLSNITADARLYGGCRDTNDNGADFKAGAAAPRNSSTAANLCVASTTLPVPEPESVALVGLGILAMVAGFVARRVRPVAAAPP